MCLWLLLKYPCFRTRSYIYISTYTHARTCCTTETYTVQVCSNTSLFLRLHPSSVLRGILQDPRWGRGQETPGEDPVVNSDYAEGFVAGFQTGEDPSKIKASACCKHYAAYSMEDSDGQSRHNTNAVVTQQDLKDTYFPAFMSCANRGNASGIMCSYNAVNGVPSCASPELLTTNLRENWGFDGYVTSDCGAVGNVANDHNYTGGDPNKTALVTLGAGMDNDCGKYFGSDAGVLGTAIESGYVPKATWMAALKNLFRVQIRLGMFDPDATQPYRYYGLEKVDTPEHRELALDAARQGMTLVKNEHNALPLKKGAGNMKIALVGPSANATVTMQSNYHGTAPYFISPADGIMKYSSAVTVVQGMSDTADNSTAGIAGAAAAAASAEATVLVVGLSGLQEGEGKCVSIEQCTQITLSSVRRCVRSVLPPLTKNPQNTFSEASH